MTRSGSADPLGLLGFGVELPPAVLVTDHVTSVGGDPTGYKSWRRVGHAGPDDHPSTMGQRALERALADARLPPEQLDLVLYTGTSRDYPVSWSVSTEIIELCGVGPGAIGMDVMAGCLATLTCLELAQGWLSLRGGGHAAVVAAERWTSTVDYTNPSLMSVWGYGDGAAAVVVGLGSHQEAQLEFVGAEYRNAASNNGYIRMAYGGTRAPVAPPGADPNKRILADRPRDFIIDLYRQGYADAFAALSKRLDFRATHLVCNQLTPGMVAMVADGLGLGDHTTVTGHETGHLGGPDLLVGFHHLLNSGQVPDSIAVGASTAYAFGAGLVVKPGTYGTVQ